MTQSPTQRHIEALIRGTWRHILHHTMHDADMQELANCLHDPDVMTAVDAIDEAVKAHRHFTTIDKRCKALVGAYETALRRCRATAA